MHHIYRLLMASMAVIALAVSCTRGTGSIPRIVTTTDVFEDGYPAEKAIDRLARLGYEGWSQERASATKRFTPDF